MMGAMPWDSYFAGLQQVAERRGVLYLDAMEILRESGLPTDQLFIDEMHPSGLANARYAEAIVRELMDAGWPGASLSPDARLPLFDEHLPDSWLESGKRPVARPPQERPQPP
jgi:hypothetical protein